MATYAYVCRACGTEFDVKRPMSERATTMLDGLMRGLLRERK